MHIIDRGCDRSFTVQINLEEWVSVLDPLQNDGTAILCFSTNGYSFLLSIGLNFRALLLPFRCKLRGKLLKFFLAYWLLPLNYAWSEKKRG